MLQGFTFVPARPSAKGLQMLEAFGNDTFWRCFEDKLEIWEATFKEAELPKLTGCNLANRKQTSSKRETNQDTSLSLVFVSGHIFHCSHFTSPVAFRYSSAVA